MSTYRRAQGIARNQNLLTRIMLLRQRRDLRICIAKTNRHAMRASNSSTLRPDSVTTAPWPMGLVRLDQSARGIGQQPPFQNHPGTGRAILEILMIGVQQDQQWRRSVCASIRPTLREKPLDQSPAFISLPSGRSQVTFLVPSRSTGSPCRKSACRNNGRRLRSAISPAVKA